MRREAIILLAHGSRDPDWARPIHSLSEQLRLLLPDTEIEPAFLELMPPDLPEAVARLASRGVAAMTVVPVLLAQGGHVKHQLPALIETLRNAYPERSIRVTPPIGEQPELIAAMASCIARLAVT